MTVEGLRARERGKRNRKKSTLYLTYCIFRSSCSPHARPSPGLRRWLRAFNVRSRFHEHCRAWKGWRASLSLVGLSELCLESFRPIDGSVACSLITTTQFKFCYKMQQESRNIEQLLLIFINWRFFYLNSSLLPLVSLKLLPSGNSNQEK